MHPIFIVVLIACAVWFFIVAAWAGRGIGVRIGLAFLGVIEFVVVVEIMEEVIEDQQFFLTAIRSGPDIGPIVMYIVLPSVIVVFLSGFLLKKVLTRPAQPKGEQ